MSSRQRLDVLLRSHRLSADLTLEGLAERSGVSDRTISDIERGVSVAPRRATIDALAEALELNVQDREVLLRAARAGRAVAAEGQRASAVAPHRVFDFTGREREIAEIASLLTQTAADVPAPLLISGPPGIGKTTSALEAISRIGGGLGQPMLFIDLDGLSTHPLTALQVLRVLLRQMPGIGEKVPTSLDEATLRWRSATAESPVTVLLDNAGNEAQIRPILTRDARSNVVVTSRRTLGGLEGLRRVALGPLSPEESVSLLGKLIPPGQRVAGDLRELAQLCDCVPLAMRIAGSRIASRPASQAADFIARMRSGENRLRLLVAGDLAVEAAFALSYDDLAPEAAALFRSISVIDTGTFDVRLAAAAFGRQDDVDVLLDQLTDLNLVEARGGNRYRLHDLLRLFGSSRLVATDGADAAEERRQRLSRWLLNTLERAGAWFEPSRRADLSGSSGARFPDAASAEAWIRLEDQHWWPAMQSAARAGDHATISDVADSLHWFSELWLEWGHWLELFGLAAEAARALGDQRLLAMHLGYMVWAAVLETSDRPNGLRLARHAVAAAEESGDHQQRGWAHFYLGWMLAKIEPNEAIAASRESITQFGVAGDTAGTNQALLLLGYSLEHGGASERAIVEYQAVLSSLNATGHGTHQLIQLITALTVHQEMSTTYLALNRPTEAIDSATRAIAIADEFRSDTRVAEALRRRATAYLAVGKGELAQADIARALRLHDRDLTVDYVSAERARLETLRIQAENPRGLGHTGATALDSM